MSKYITCQKGKLDINGNRLYIYNFIDTESELEQKEINSLFRYFGRLSNKGITNQSNIKEFSEWIKQFAVWNNMDIGYKLGRAQKDIDRCNSKSGCNSCCSGSRQETCTKLNTHSQLMDELSYIHEFLDAEIEMLEE